MFHRMMTTETGALAPTEVEHDKCTVEDCNLIADAYPNYRRPITGKCASHAEGKTPRWDFRLGKDMLRELAAGRVPQGIAARAARILEKA